MTREEEMPKWEVIPMNQIDPLARKIAVAWHKNATDWIGDKHKLASDIMNYARETNIEKDKEIERLKGLLKKLFSGGMKLTIGMWEDTDPEKEWQDFEKAHNL